MTFSELNLTKPLLSALTDLEYEYPTPIQEKAFPVIMSGKHVVGIAQTGTGKTFAYLLPILRQLPFSKQKDPRVIILAPTRVLVVQIVKELEKLTKYTQLRVAAIYGGTNINTQKKTIFNGLDIIVATPGRLIDLTLTGVLRLKLVQKLVIDEVDEMLSLGFRTQLTSVLELLPAKRQNLMFSATLTADIDEFITNTLPVCYKIEIEPHGTPIDKIEQNAFQVPNFNTKLNLFEHLLKTDASLNKVLVFVESKKVADKLFDHFDKIFPDEFTVVHSNKAHNTKLNSLKMFQDGERRVLIATDIIARGMDIIDVSHVVNFDIPTEPHEYIHRIGRTGRAGSDGIAIAFVSPPEEEFIDAIESLMNRQLILQSLPNKKLVSNIFTDEEKDARFTGKNYLKAPSIKGSQGAYHEKKEKNMKVNLGGPKIRKEKFTKFGKPKLTRKTSKTRF